MNFLFSVLRWIFSRLDYIVIFVITQLYSLLVQIMDTNVFNKLIYQYLGRIYTFLGVFMVFKLSLSIINYVINPDMLSDKSKGFGKLITNVVISLILLAITPNLFNAAFNLQTDILKSNAVYQIVTGKKLKNNMADKGSDFDPNNQAKLIAYGVYSSFIYKDIGDNEDLSSIDPNETDIHAECKDETTGCSNGKCSGKNPYCLVDGDTVTKEGKDSKAFANTYWFLISTVCGGFVAYILLTFCIDASLRAVKLGFLQIIAPIPIMSMIDPKVGNEKVMKWGKECLMTFIDLFIKLAGLFFAVDVITAVITSDGMIKYSDGAAVKNPFVQLFIILGCLMFAKKLPSMLESILGIKLSGGDGFSLKKKLGGVPGLGVAKAAGAGALGFAGGMAANAWATRGNWKGQGFKGALGNVGSMLAGGMSGAGRGLFSKEKNMFKAAGAGIKGSVGARNLRDERNATGEGGIKGWGSRRIAGLDKFAGVTNDDTAKIAAQRDLGEKLWEQVNGNPNKNLEPVYTSKYDIPGISDEFKDAWKISDKAKDYRNSINSQLSMARSDFQAGKEIQWGGKAGAAAIAELEVESAKASAAYDKASADFKELRSMQKHKAEATYYDAYNAADDRHSAESYAKKTVVEYSSSAKSSSQSKTQPKDMHSNDDTYYSDMGM